jgi:uncharacterized protein (DUF2147 family)
MILAILAAASLSPDVVLGRWQAETRHATTVITRCGASICGRVVDSDGLRADPNLADTNNKDAAQRGRRIKNLVFLSGFRWSNGAWTGGTVYNPEDGGTYHGTITPIDADHIKLRGCIFWPLCKTQTWTRLR